MGSQAPKHTIPPGPQTVLHVTDPEHAGRRTAFGRDLSDDVVERRPAVLERYGRRTQVVHAAGRTPAADDATAAAAAETGPAAKGHGRRQQEIPFGGGRGRLAAEKRRVAQTRRGRRGRSGQPFFGAGRREQAARPAFLHGHQRTVTAAVAAQRGRERRRGRDARHAALGHRGGRGRAHRHRQHGTAGARGPALVLHQRLDVRRGFRLARPAGHQRAVAVRRLAARSRQRPASSEHGVLPRPDLERAVRRLDRLEYGRRFQATVHVEFGERRAVLKTEKRRALFSIRVLLLLLLGT